MSARPFPAAASAATLLLALPAAAQDLAAGRWIDLTHPFNEDAVYWPTAEMFELEEVFHGHTEGGWCYTAYNFSAAEHGGTHIDAPIHFAEGALTADAIPIDQMIGPGFVIDVRDKVAVDVDYRVGPADIEAYMGTAERGEAAVAKLHFPGLGKDGGELLVARGIGAVGIDTPSIDHGQSPNFETHVTLMTNDIPAFENVADMSELPPKGATIVALPMKIEGGSGGPRRIVAHLPD
jgi:kynurenine formamidase